MNDELTIKDFWLFIKDSKKIIGLTILSVTLLLLGYSLLNFFTSSRVEEAEPVETEETIPTSYEELEEVPFELMTTSEVVYMQDYLEEKAYKFMFFVKNTNDEPIGNLNMMRAIFRHERVVEQVEEVLGERLFPDPTLSVNILSFADSGLFQLQLGRVNNEASERLAQVYYDLIENGEIEVLNEFEVTLFEDSPIPLTHLVTEEEVDETIVTERNNVLLIRNLVMMSIVGIAAGLLLGIAVAVLLSYLSKYVSHIYIYENKFNDKIVRLNHLSDNEETKGKLNQNILYPKNSKKLVLIDQHSLDGTKTNIGELSSEDILVRNDFSELATDQDIDEVIILSQLHKTRKAWYKNQRVQLSGYAFPVKIIQI